MEYVVPLQARVLSCRRSGVHAVINWLSRLTPRPVIHLNNIRGPNPWRDCTEYVGFQIGPRSTWASRPLKPGSLILSWEDHTIADCFDSPDYTEHQELAVGACTRMIGLVVIRDPFNMLASRLRTEHENQYITQQAINCWISHAVYVQAWNEAAIAQKGLLEGGPYWALPLMFNEWTTAEDYREELANILGLAYNEEAEAELDYVADLGQGSSFNGMQYQGRARLMTVNRRWHNCRDLVVNAINTHPERDKIYELATLLFPTETRLFRQRD